MDVYCPVCGEPWDATELTEFRGPHGLAWSVFKRLGCEALGARHSDRQVSDDKMAKIQVIMDLASYPDDAAADFDDLLWS